MARKPKKYNSSSSEQRHKQDSQAFLIYGILLTLCLIGWLWTGARECFIGALQASIGPLFIITLRYIFRVKSGYRMDQMGMLTALLFVVSVVLILCYCLPTTLWAWFVILLGFVATVFGVQKFKFSPVFMLINCLVAGALLLP